MEMKTYLAVGELAQAAAHIHGVTGPVMFTVSRHTELEWCNNCGDCWMCTDEANDDLRTVDTADVDDFFYHQSFA